MHYEIRSQDASSSDPPTMGSTVTRRLPKKDRVPAQGSAPAEGTRLAGAAPVREEGRALPYLLARDNHVRFPGAHAHGPWHDIRGRHETDLGSRQLPTARWPRNADGPVLQHRPDGTPPRLWTELEGLAM